MKIRKFLKVLNFLFIILAAEVIIGLVCITNKIKDAKYEEDKTSVTQIAINPIEKKLAKYSSVRITSSSDVILKYIINKISDEIWLTWDEQKNMNPVEASLERNNRKALHKISGGYYIEVPSRYFSSDTCKKEKEFNFSGLNIGGITTLPDFSKWPNLRRLNFSNCKISGTSGFMTSSGRKALKNITYIDLSKNNIESINDGIVHDARYNLQHQIITKYLGTIKSGNTGNSTLPDIFVKSYGNIVAPTYYKENIVKISGKKVTVKSKGKEQEKAMVRIPGTSSSPFKGSYVMFNWSGIKASTNPNNNNNNNNNNNQIYYNISLSYKSSTTSGWEQIKYIEIYPTFGENVNYNNAKVYVNGNYVGNNKVKYPVTKNGKYTIKITYPGLRDLILNQEVKGIDREHPTFTTNYRSEIGKNIKYLTVYAKDNVAIKNISVNGTNIYSCNKKDYYCAYSKTYKITKSGKYTIKVEDLAGNWRKIEENVKVDTTPPKIQSLQIKKNDKIYDKDKCAVKVGDKLILNLKAHEEVSKYSGIKINGVDLKTNTINVGNKTNFSIEIPITDKFGAGALYGDYVIEIYGISDKWGNATSYVIKNKVYFDSSYPEISEINITGGKLSYDKQKMTIYQNQKIIIDLTTEEKLGNNPEIYVCGHKTTFARLKNKNKKDKSEIYHYYAYLDSNYILQTANAFGYVDKCIPIEIKNYKNLSGNLGDDIIIDESNKSSNGIYLYYGNSELNKLYLASDKNEKDRAIAGDINQDGYVNEYDYLLLQRYLSKLQELTDDQKKYANVDGNESIDANDLTALKVIINKRVNSLQIGSSETFKVYDNENKLVSGDNLKLSVTEGEEFINVTENEDGISIKSKNELSALNGSVVIKATYLNEKNEEEKAGEIKLKIIDKNNVTTGFEVITGKKVNKNILGDVNKDGFITEVDSFDVQRAIVNLIQLTEEGKERGDINKDGVLTVSDATDIQKMCVNNYNGMYKNDVFTLKFNSFEDNNYEDIKDENIQNQIRWYAEGQADMVTITPNNDGSANIKVNENAVTGSKIVICCSMLDENSEDNKYKTARFNIEIIDKAYVELSENTINYDLSNLPDKYTYLKVNTNLDNKDAEWKSSDENIVKLKEDSYGNVEVIPVKEGTAKVTVTIDGISDECDVKVEKSITKIYTSKQDITLKESLEDEEYIIANSVSKLLKSSANSQDIEGEIDATEEPIITSSDEDIARMYKDEETGAYKILAISEGEATIEISSPTNEDVKETIKVNVKPLNIPTIQKVTIDQDEGQQEYKKGKKISFKVVFSEEIKGEVPELQLVFGNNSSVGIPEFVGIEDNNTAIRYEYEVQEGDNGILKILGLNGGNLTDDTGKMDTILTVNNEEEEFTIEETEENIDIENETLEVSSNDESEDESKELSEEYISSNTKAFVGDDVTEQDEMSDELTGNLETVPNGINLLVGEVIADTTAPEITVVPEIEKDSYYLNKGDIVKVNITSNEDLAELPTVTMGGQVATVEGSGKEYTASLEINDKIKEGYLEIQVSGCRDLSGNEANLTVINEENMDEPIVIDYSKSTIKTIDIMAEEGKNYKAGDKVKIKVVFEDENMKNRNEYIAAEEVPVLNIKFGRNKAEGNLESDYTVGEYVNSIIYTYTISEKDIGKMTINNITGNIEDAAGNKTDLSKINISNVVTGQINEIVKENESNSNKNEGVLEKLPFKLPYTGSVAFWIIIASVGVGATIAGVSYIVRKKHYIK
ncbi:dockerin type I domain-containing protein [uncultured Clostridium sp.]|uniref:dockerin type I domain-containing protein n=1 Tax=uncultured Clostridium sp. TaxID=59620 RepID=UPI0025FAFAF1|nr:dockerin type I domain-containing protein [uncultured Clostridium sp.]